MWSSSCIWLTSRTAQLNQQQRSQVIEGYNQRKQTEAQVAPIYAVANVLSPNIN